MMSTLEKVDICNSDQQIQPILIIKNTAPRGGRKGNTAGKFEPKKSSPPHQATIQAQLVDLVLGGLRASPGSPRSIACNATTTKLKQQHRQIKFCLPSGYCPGREGYKSCRCTHHLASHFKQGKAKRSWKSYGYKGPKGRLVR